MLMGLFDINLPFDTINEWFGADRDDEVRADNTNLQREFAQNTIRWRVEDAKAAGLHPLFGLQGNNATFSPNAVSVGEGGSVGARFEPGMPSGSRQAAEDRQRFEEEMAEREQQSRHARTMSDIATDTEQQSLLRAQTDLAREQAAASLAARTGQIGRVNKEREGLRHEPTNPEDAFETKPRPIMQGTESSGGAIAVGPAAAGFEPVWIAPGLPALVPAGSAQNLGDMEFTGWVASIAATMVWWGDTAARELWTHAKRGGKAYVGMWEAAERKAEQILFERRGRGR